MSQAASSGGSALVLLPEVIQDGEDYRIIVELTSERTSIDRAGLLGVLDGGDESNMELVFRVRNPGVVSGWDYHYGGGVRKCSDTKVVKDVSYPANLDAPDSWKILSSAAPSEANAFARLRGRPEGDGLMTSTHRFYRIDERTYNAVRELYLDEKKFCRWLASTNR